MGFELLLCELHVIAIVANTRSVSQRHPESVTKLRTPKKWLDA
jgi:hypothetical protein